MTPQQAAEAHKHQQLPDAVVVRGAESEPGHMLVASTTPDSAKAALRQMGYTLDFEERTSGPINGILFDRLHGTMWGASSNHGEDYGIAW